MFEIKVPKPFKANVVITDAYLIDCMPSSILNGAIPHYILFPSHSIFPYPQK